MAGGATEETYDLVVGFLRGIGAEREAEMYLKLFRRGPRLSFAVVEIADDITPASLSRLALDLAFLARLDLFPVVLHGTGERRRRRRAPADRQLYLFRPPDRRTRLMIEAFNETLAGSIDVAGGDSEAITSGVFFVESDDEEPREVDEVRLGRIVRAVGRDRIPVLAAIGADESGTLHPIPVDEAARALVARLRPKKYIRLAESGGLHRADGSVIDYLNLALDAEGIARGRIPRREDRPVLGAVRSILYSTGERTTAQLTSPANFLLELFTTRGAGTLVRAGTRIEEHRSFREVNRTRLRRLLESSFGGRLAPGYLRVPVKSIFLERDYRGVAIVRPLGRYTYLDKFAVRPEARGDGLGSDLWSLVRRRHRRLVWRSRDGNPLNAWYAARADGMQRAGRWVVFWAGLTADEAPRAVRAAAALPATILDRAAETTAPETREMEA